MLSARAVTVSLDGRLVLNEVSVSVAAGDRLGIVGPNGIGKTTLLRALAGEVPLDGGAVERAPKSLTVGFLPQETDARPGETLRGYLGRRTGVAAASAELDRLTGALATDPDAAEEYSDVLDQFLALGGDDLDARIGAVCADLGLAADRLEVEVAMLSGGQAARAALAAILLSRFDVLLLDEPTNNLDFAGLDRLEQFVRDASGAVVVVSHDRAFLDASVDRMLELQEETRRAVEYAGSWSDYVAARDLARSQQYARYDEFRSKRSALLERVPDPEGVVRPGRAQGAEGRRERQAHPPREDRAQREAGGEGQDHGAGDRSPRSGREAVGGLGAPARARADGPQRRRRRAAQPGRGATRDVRARAPGPRDRLAGTDRDPGAERERQDHLAPGAVGGDPARRRGSGGSGRGCRSARWIRLGRSYRTTSR